MAKQKVQIQLLNETNGEVVGDVEPTYKCGLCKFFGRQDISARKYDAGELRGTPGAKKEIEEDGPQGPQGVERCYWWKQDHREHKVSRDRQGKHLKCKDVCLCKCDERRLCQRWSKARAVCND